MSKVLNQQKGMTLVEIVAGILIIGLLLISFFGIFISSKKTGIASEEIVDGTYIAQEAMEEVYFSTKHMSLQPLIDNYLADTDKTNVATNYSSTNQQSFTVAYDHHEFANTRVEIFFKKMTRSELPSNVNMYNITISVKENAVIKSTMENIFPVKM